MSMISIRYQGAVLRDHHILLLKVSVQGGQRIFWEIPGGSREPGETEEVCVAREIAEETHLQVAVERLILDEPASPGYGYERQRTYLCRIVSDEAEPGHEPEAPDPAVSAIAGVGWFDLRDPASWGEGVHGDPITYSNLVGVRRALGYSSAISEVSIWEGRLLEVVWGADLPRPPRELVTQASGVCFTDDGKIVIVAKLPGQWALPGGHPEPGETLDAAFVREVQEEASAVVEQVAYLGAQQVDDLAPGGAGRYFQARFWARVRLEPFIPRNETVYRALVEPAMLLPSLNWHTAQIAQAILRAALDAEDRFRQH